MVTESGSLLDAFEVPPSAPGPASTLLPSLSPFQRVLLATDGTVTDILSAYLGEDVTLVKRRHGSIVAPRAIRALEVTAGTPLIEREVLLTGARSGRTLVYAASIVVPERLTGTLRDQLRVTSKPVGQLMLEERAETYREILRHWCEPAGALGAHFGIDASVDLIARTYRVFSERRPIMLISEKFPRSAFTEPGA